MISLAVKPPDVAKAILAKAWRGTPHDPALAMTAAAEHMRSVIYGKFAAPSYASAGRTVHTTRVLGGARRVVELVWPQYGGRTAGDEPARDFCSAVLDRMKALGDAAALGGGQWLATPLRFIVASGPHLLLVGTAPGEAVRQRLGVQPASAGVSRFIGAEAVEASGAANLVQKCDAWFGGGPPMTQWTHETLAKHEARMEPAQGVSADQLEIYAPDIARSQRRQGRWIPAGQIAQAIEGTRVCRPLARFAPSYDRPSLLAQFAFTHGALTIRRSTAIDRKQELRLCYGLDIRLGTPRRIALSVSGDFLSIAKPLRLPQPEARVYELGWPDPAAREDDRTLTFHVHALPFLQCAFQRMNWKPVMTTGGTQ